MDQAVLRHLSKDRILRQVIPPERQRPVLTIKNDLYLHLVRSIVGQQLSTKAAQTIFLRFTRLFSNEYPDPVQLMTMSDDALRSAGLSRQKIGYVKNVADYFTTHSLFNKDWTIHSDEEVLATLTQIKGVGNWTAQMILMFTLARPDIFPSEDVGIQNAMCRLYGLEEKGKALRAKMGAIAKAWQPYRSYACYLLWRYLDAPSLEKG